MYLVTKQRHWPKSISDPMAALGGEVGGSTKLLWQRPEGEHERRCGIDHDPSGGLSSISS